MLQHDRLIKISAAGSRYAEQWPAQELCLQDFYARLAAPVRSTENRAQYLAMPKNKQDNLKDVGGFVGGVLAGGLRRAGACAGRDLITLDIDQVDAGGTNDVLRRLAGLGCGWAVYSTRKHGPEMPRLRAIIPTDRTLTADEYEPAARKVASIIDPTLAIFDKTTFQPVRLMYWPSVCKDGEYINLYEDKPLLSADGLLGMYADWRDVASWPLVPGENDGLHRVAERAEDPTSKKGVVGAFCRTYSIYDAIEQFLPGVYEATGHDDRLTYTAGSTTGGAIVYNDGLYLYSHHGTDPAGGRLCNAFDLVRLHKFGDLDASPDVKSKTPINKLPSYAAMTQFAVGNPVVQEHLNRERFVQAEDDFGAPSSATGKETDFSWTKDLDLNGQGAPEKSLKNYTLIVQNHPELKGRIKENLFSGRVDICGNLPWGRPRGSQLWTDTDTTNLRTFLEPFCGKISKNDMNDVVEACAGLDAYHPVKDYLGGLIWDGAPRLDRLLIDYLGADDNTYTRAVTRKAFVAAVARIMAPGIKYDTMLVLIGGQGRYKSTLFSMMGGKWFSDSLKSFDGKDAMETIQGTWINEISEMQAMQKSEVNAVKAFLSKQADYYRAAYGRHVGERPRQCVFFGTSNEHDVLTDSTGGRRFWPVDIDKRERMKNVFADLPGERDQIWAEAIIRWKIGEPLYLTGEAADISAYEQETHREQSPREGVIKEFLEKEVPTDWYKWDLAHRRAFWGGGVVDGLSLVPRDRVCALEVWCEALGGDSKNMQYRDAREINGILARQEGWERTKNGARFGYCGLQKGFVKP